MMLGGRAGRLRLNWPRRGWARDSWSSVLDPCIVGVSDRQARDVALFQTGPHTPGKLVGTLAVPVRSKIYLSDIMAIQPAERPQAELPAC